MSFLGCFPEGRPAGLAKTVVDMSAVSGGGGPCLLVVHWPRGPLPPGAGVAARLEAEANVGRPRYSVGHGYVRERDSLDDAIERHFGLRVSPLRCAK